MIEVQGPASRRPQRARERRTGERTKSERALREELLMRIRWQGNLAVVWARAKSERRVEPSAAAKRGVAERLAMGVDPIAVINDVGPRAH